MEQIISESLRDSIHAKQLLVNNQLSEIIQLVEEIVGTFRDGRKMLIFGNGGSAADAQHMAGEFVNRFIIERDPLPAIALTTDTSILTCIGNDVSFDDIFVKQVQALGKPGDLALGISTSGNSANVLKAIGMARNLGLKTAALTGGTGGKLIDLADTVINVPVDQTPYIQEAHLWVEHLVCRLVDEKLFGSLK
ncbi:SIS domain-containing protein [Thermodesulfobacteriota bacterium]